MIEEETIYIGGHGISFSGLVFLRGGAWDILVKVWVKSRDRERVGWLEKEKKAPPLVVVVEVVMSEGGRARSFRRWRERSKSFGRERGRFENVLKGLGNQFDKEVLGLKFFFSVWEFYGFVNENFLRLVPKKMLNKMLFCLIFIDQSFNVFDYKEIIQKKKKDKKIIINLLRIWVNYGKEHNKYEHVLPTK